MHEYYHPGAPLSASDLDRLDGTDQWAALISTDPGDIGSRLEVLLNVDPTNNQGDINSSVLNDPAGTENKLHARTATTVRAFKCVRPRSPPSAAPGAHLNPHTYALEPIHAGWSGYAGIVTSDGWKLTLGDPGKQNNTQLRTRTRARAVTCTYACTQGFQTGGAGLRKTRRLQEHFLPQWRTVTLEIMALCANPFVKAPACRETIFAPVWLR